MVCGLYTGSTLISNYIYIINYIKNITTIDIIFGKFKLVVLNSKW
jgi:hypothetical protein